MKNEIVQIIADIIGAPPETIAECDDFVTELAVNSLQRMQILDEIENRFGITIPVRESAQKMRSAAGISELVEGLQK